MKTEISAGGIIVRKKSAGWQVLLMRDMNESWTFPKGVIEKNEKPQDAAKREILEEVGLGNVKLLKKLSPILYMYKRNGLISKTVYYFLFKHSGYGMPKAQREEGISEATWVSFPKAERIIGYAKTNTNLLKEAHTFLMSL